MISRWFVVANQRARSSHFFFIFHFCFKWRRKTREAKRKANYKLLYKFNGKNSENQTVQINKNARPHMPEGKIIEKVRAWAVLVRRPEDSYHKRFLSHSSYFAFQHFSHLSHFEKNRIYCISAECNKSQRNRILLDFFLALNLHLIFKIFSHLHRIRF